MTSSRLRRVTGFEASVLRLMPSCCFALSCHCIAAMMMVVGNDAEDEGGDDDQYSFTTV